MKKLLRIGDHLVNEKYFIGLFTVGMVEDGTTGEYHYVMEARWLEGAEVMSQVMTRCCISQGNGSKEDKFYRATSDAFASMEY